MDFETECREIVFTAMRKTASSNTAQTLYGEKVSALILLLAKCNYYENECYIPELITEICRKKSEFIKEAATKTDIEMIMKPPDVRYDGNEVLPANKYCIAEEEILAWSRTSLTAPLNTAGQRRYEKLFKELFPDKAYILDK